MTTKRSFDVQASSHVTGSCTSLVSQSESRAANRPEPRKVVTTGRRRPSCTEPRSTLIIEMGAWLRAARFGAPKLCLASSDHRVVHVSALRSALIGWTIVSSEATAAPLRPCIWSPAALLLAVRRSSANVDELACACLRGSASATTSVPPSCSAAHSPIACPCDPSVDAHSSLISTPRATSDAKYSSAYGQPATMDAR